ncbi:hypothetical protein GCM10009578_019170 [Streptomyces rhizosphaericus]
MLCGRSSRGTDAQNVACARTSATPEASSTADAQGPSWCEPTITQWSEAPGRVPTTLWVVSSVMVASETIRPSHSPDAISSRTRCPSLPLSQMPGMERRSAS